MIEVLVIGPGRMGQNYATVLNANPDVKIVGVVGNSMNSAIKLASELDVPAFPNRNYNESLSQFSSDNRAVVITTSEWAHLEPLTFALNLGLPVIIEKPLVGNYEEFMHVRELLYNHKTHILPCFTSRFDPRFYQAKKLLKSSKVTPELFYCRRNTDYETAKRVHRKIPWPYWIICHDIDLIRWFSGVEVDSVRATSRVSGKMDLDRDFLQVELKLKNKSVAFIESSWSLPRVQGPFAHSNFRIITEEQSIEIPFEPGIKCASSNSYFEYDTMDFQVQYGNPIGNTPNMINHFELIL